MPELEQKDVLKGYHDDVCGGHMSGRATAFKVLHASFYWSSLFKDAISYVKRCDRCQRFGSLTKKNEMPQQPILFLEPFEALGIDYVEPIGI